jgi:hypothetical protein
LTRKETRLVISKSFVNPNREGKNKSCNLFFLNQNREKHGKQKEQNRKGESEGKKNSNPLLACWRSTPKGKKKFKS